MYVGKITTFIENPESVKEQGQKFTRVQYSIKGKKYWRDIETYRIDRIKEVAKEMEIFPEDLLAICIQESFNCSDEAVGDGGKAIGSFQIHRGFHSHISVEQARNFDFSLNWTAKRLLAKGYNSHNEWQRRVAISRHNGSGEKAYWYGITRIHVAKQLSNQI